MEVLKHFYDATHTFSYVYRPTSHEFLDQALNVAGVFMEGEKIEEIKYTILQMKLKWRSYFKIIPDIYLVVFVFYPRFRNKFDLLHEMLDTYYEMLGLDDDEPINVVQIVTKLKLLINELLEFDSISSTSNDESTSSILLPTTPPRPHWNGD